DPYASLDPRMRVGELVAEPLLIHNIGTPKERTDRVAALFERVGLSADQMERYPHEFSGGQRQRICIARALALRPKLIIADESVSALDVSVQARLLDLLRGLVHDLGLAVIIVTHDLAVARLLSHRMMVMKDGRVVEHGLTDRLLDDPQAPYTPLLVSSI
ncbi:ATP-binding cassette domain-containing protein, partial [Streptococcus dysgalactiae]